MTPAEPPFKLFLSYNRRDNPAVKRLAQALRDPDLSLFKDDWYLDAVFRTC